MPELSIEKIVLHCGMSDIFKHSSDVGSDKPASNNSY